MAISQRLIPSLLETSFEDEYASKGGKSTINIRTNDDHHNIINMHVPMMDRVSKVWDLWC